MYLRPVDVVSNISGEEFKEKYFDPQVPVIIKDLVKDWSP
jgi:hypothetical protein